MAKKKEPAIAVDNQEVAAAVNEATAPVNAVIEQEFEAEVDILSLQPHPQNPNEGDEKAILGSITDIGFYGAVIAQKSTRTILVGEHRWKAAKAKKAKTIPVVWVNRHAQSVSAGRHPVGNHPTGARARGDAASHSYFVRRLAA